MGDLVFDLERWDHMAKPPCWRAIHQSRNKMLSEAQIRNYLAKNENLLRENKGTELDPKEIKNNYYYQEISECRKLVHRALFTARIQTLRKVLELDNNKVGEGEGKRKIKDKDKDKGSYRSLGNINRNLYYFLK